MDEGRPDFTNLIRAAKGHVQARVLRIAGRRLQLAGADL